MTINQTPSGQTPPEPANTGAWLLWIVALLAFGAAALAWERQTVPLVTAPADPPADRLPGRWPWIVPAGLLVLALALRLPNLDGIPAGLWFDEAQNGLVAQQLLAGRRGAPDVYRQPDADGRALLLRARLRAQADRAAGLAAAAAARARRGGDRAAGLRARRAALRLARGAGGGRAGRAVGLEPDLQPLRPRLAADGGPRRGGVHLRGAGAAHRAAGLLRGERGAARLRLADVLRLTPGAAGAGPGADPPAGHGAGAAGARRARGHRRLRGRRHPRLPAAGPLRIAAARHFHGARRHGLDLQPGEHERRPERLADQPEQAPAHVQLPGRRQRAAQSFGRADARRRDRGALLPRTGHLPAARVALAILLPGGLVGRGAVGRRAVAAVRGAAEPPHAGGERGDGAAGGHRAGRGGADRRADAAAPTAARGAARGLGRGAGARAAGDRLGRQHHAAALLPHAGRLARHLGGHERAAGRGRDHPARFGRSSTRSS